MLQVDFNFDWLFFFSFGLQWFFFVFLVFLKYFFLETVQSEFYYPALQAFLVSLTDGMGFVNIFYNYVFAGIAFSCQRFGNLV